MLRDAIESSLDRLPVLRRRMESMRTDLALRYDWDALVPRYIEMFEGAAESPTETIAKELGRA